MYNPKALCMEYLPTITTNSSLNVGEYSTHGAYKVAQKPVTNVVIIPTRRVFHFSETHLNHLIFGHLLGLYYNPMYHRVWGPPCKYFEERPPIPEYTEHMGIYV